VEIHRPHPRFRHCSSGGSWCGSVGRGVVVRRCAPCRPAAELLVYHSSSGKLSANQNSTACVTPSFHRPPGIVFLRPVCRAHSAITLMRSIYVVNLAVVPGSECNPDFRQSPANLRTDARRGVGKISSFFFFGGACSNRDHPARCSAAGGAATPVLRLPRGVSGKNAPRTFGGVALAHHPPAPLAGGAEWSGRRLTRIGV